MSQELEHEAKDKLMKQNALRNANQLLIYEKELVKDQEVADKMNEKRDHFPFTHGETISAHR